MRSRYRFEIIQEGSDFVLERGHEISGGGTILVRSLVSEHPAATHFKWLEHEFSLRSNLSSEWAVLPLHLTRHDARISLVLEDPGGQTLDRDLCGPMETAKFLRLALLAAGTLGCMHRQGLIHKDIKPTNLFIDASGKVRITGFGLASTLPRERQAAIPLEVIAGTFAYMAPEQTGRMNRSMDTRSDLYSLGITFYEMLTGHLPFSADDPLGWVHCHTALQPVPPHKRAKVPEQLSSIIMKLLAKTADERYQTASGLVTDLLKCEHNWTQGRSIAPFPLGAKDISERLLISERLYGRDKEKQLLLAAFERVVASGACELVLVSGYSGIGKSSVVNELHKALVPPRGLFAAGKFDQYKRDIPYATIAQAFQSLIRQILGKSERELEYWRESLEEALGPNGQIIVNLIPELEIIIGPQPPAAELSAQDAANRFQMVFRKFIGVFARAEHPLALFLDDLQWLDMATLQLLQYLMLEPQVRHVLFVGAFRDNEVTNAHPLSRTIEDIRKADRPVEDVVLSPLSIVDIGHLIEDAIHCPPGEASSLTRLVFEKTGGNPFFAIQFLTELAEEKLVVFDSESGAWRWNIEQIQAKGFTDNVVDLMAAKLNRLSEETRRTLQCLSCLGNSADADTLALVQECPEQTIYRILAEAVHSGLVLRNATTFSFLHDRVQEASYAMIPKSARALSHLKIGRLLASATGPEQQQENIFEIVNQFERGIDLIEDQAERDNVASLFFAAARRAQTSTAYESAVKYLNAARWLLGEDSWNRKYELTFAIELNLAECEFLVGKIEPAEQRIRALIGRGKRKVDLAAAYRLRITMYVVMSENHQAVFAALECLSLFGIEMSAHPELTDVSMAFADIERRLAGRPVETLIDLPLATDPDVEAAMSVLSVLWAPAIYTDEPLVGLHVCHMVRLTLEFGVTSASPQGLGWYGIMLGHLSFGDYKEGYKFGVLAVNIVEKYRFTAYQAKALYSLHMLSLWNRPISAALETIESVFLACVKTGDVTIACYACNHMVNDRLERGDHLDEVLRETERGLTYVEKVGYRIVQDCILSLQRGILHLQGRTKSFGTLDGNDFSEASFEQDLTPDSMATVVFWYWTIKGQARYMSGRFAEAAAAFERARPISWGSPGHIQNADFQFFSALTLAALDSSEKEDAAALSGRSHILAAHKELARWASSCPTTFAAKHALISAEIARIEGRTLEAIHFYQRSVSLARDNGTVHYEAIAHELAARFHMSIGLETAGQAHLRLSRECYERWGAYGKVLEIDSLFPALRHSKVSFSSVNTTDTPIGRLDLFAVVKASQAISREIILDDLIRTLLSISVELAGADRGLLILLRDEVPLVVAEATTSRGQLETILRYSEISASELALAPLQYVIRTRESLILDDASRSSDFATDEYVRSHQSKSILLVPIVKQGRFRGILYLENELTAYAFTADRVELLEMLSSQAAISLENASLYTELQRSEAFLSEGQRHSSTATWTWNVQTGELRWSAEHFRLFGYEPGEVKPDFTLFWEHVHPEDRSFVEQTLSSAVADRKPFSFEFRGIPRSGGELYFLTIGRELESETGNVKEYMGTLIDISERKLGAQALLNAQEDFRRVSQLMIMGELAASIAHEVNQPIAAMVTNANACLRWLAEGTMDIAGARKTAQSIVHEGHRAGEIIKGIYRLSKKQPPDTKPFDIDVVIREVVVLMRSELERRGILLQAELNASTAVIHGDGVQLRQVILNIVRNSVEAMSSTVGRQRVLRVSSKVMDYEQIQVVIEDTGPGIDPVIAAKIFNPFVTTKSDGMGMGLSICHTIVESHGGQLWLSKTGTEGTIFQLSLPAAVPEVLSEDAA
jgi:PAS domain S-box-containing protein